MIFEVKISQMICIWGIFLFPMLCWCNPQTCNNVADVQQFYKGLETFGVRLYSELAKGNSEQNTIFSPFSINACLGMVRMGAEGQTAIEMDQGLALTKQCPQHLANNFHNILEQYENSSVLKIANKIYIDRSYKLQDKFNDLLTEQFYSSVDAINFANQIEAAKTINTWVKNKTNNLIKDLIEAESLEPDTVLMLINAIHFNGAWVYPFPKYGTREQDFYLDETNTFKVQMMQLTEKFNYGEFPELDAAALELPYKNSDLSLLIILPHSRTGFVYLEQKLQTVSISNLINRMSPTDALVDLPKFKAEFKKELSKPLMNLGLKRMFSDAAELGKMLKTPKPLKVTSAIHKAFIEVNESGTEAAAATGTGLASRAARYYKVKFIVNRPFYYVIKNKKNVVIFAGSIKTKF